MSRYKDVNFNKGIDSIPREKFAEMLRKDMIAAEEEHQDFLSKLKEGKCYLCGKDMNDIDVGHPCFHWFAYPIGIKKKNFNDYLKKPIGFFELSCYLRWLANSETQMVNINSLKAEMSKNCVLECTYKFRNVVWAFSVGRTDKEGHEGGKVGDVPHYHLQMKVDGRPFINFNDFHIPFSDMDLLRLGLEEQTKGRFKTVFPFGMGAEILEDEDLDAKELDKGLRAAHEDQDKAPFCRQSIITSKNKSGFSGDLIADALEESKKTKEPISRILKRKLGDTINVEAVIYPSELIPEMEKRSGKK
jgi:hypothetical protein